jgi:hypothetical protein
LQHGQEEEILLFEEPAEILLFSAPVGEEVEEVA